MGRFFKAAEAMRNAADSASKALNESELVERSKKAYEEWNTTEPFPYEPLPTPTSIRLLKLEPCKAMKKSGNTNVPSDADGEDDEDDVQFAMHTAELDRNPNFTALSYTWRQQYSQTGSWLRHWSRVGVKYFNDEIDQKRYEIPEADAPLTETRKVICNGYSFKVSDNLFDALKQLRRKRPGEWLWIDAICMNQKDPTELQAQIKIMGRIYQSCRSTVVWLGRMSKSAKLGLSHLNEMVKSQEPLPPYPMYTFLYGNTMAEDFRIESAATTAFHLTQRSWFKRVWVLQELLLARDVVYYHGKHVIDLETLITATQWTMDTGIGRSNAEPFMLQSFIAPYYVAHMHFLPMTLKAREDFAKGKKWTLSQWFQACSGRLASVAKDYVFAGLSLVEGDLLSVDQSLQPVAQRPKLPPRPLGTITSAPTTAESQSPGALEEKSLTPQGLWPRLVPDYSASDAEVFVVAAACLLSHASVQDLLRISARLRDIYQFRDSEPLRPRDLDAWSGLPSWVPALGSWTSHLTTALSPTDFAEHKPPAPQTRNNQDPNLHKPCISPNGRILSISAATIDVVASCKAQKDEPRASKELRRLLQFLASGTGIYRDDHHAETIPPSDEAVSNPPSAAPTHCLLEAVAITLVAGHVDGKPITPSEAGSRLCESLESKVKHLILELEFKIKHSQEVRQKIEEKARKKKHDIEYLETAEDDAAATRWRESKEAELSHKETIKDVTADLEAVKERYSHLDWPGETALAAILTKEKAETVKAQRKVRELELQRQNSSGSGVDDDGRSSTLSTINSSISGTIERSKKGIIDYLDEQYIDLQMRDMAVRYQRIISDECRAYEETYMEIFTWRKIIMTEKGHVGIAPLWVEEGDSIMVLPGALMPFVFAREEEDLVREEARIKERLIHVGSDSDEDTLWTTFKPQLDARLVDVRRQLEKLRVEGRDRWVLIGEAYIDSQPRGESTDDMTFGTIEIT